MSKLEEEAIKKFADYMYGYEIEKFSTYCDGEVYGITNGIQIPISTVYKWLTTDLKKKGCLSVDSNNILKYGVLKRGKFHPIR